MRLDGSRRIRSSAGIRLIERASLRPHTSLRASVAFGCTRPSSASQPESLSWLLAPSYARDRRHRPRSMRCSQSPFVRGQSDWWLAQLANGSRQWTEQSAFPPHTRQGCAPDTLIQSASPNKEVCSSRMRTKKEHKVCQAPYPGRAPPRQTRTHPTTGVAG
jgi:hypothetical protein